MVQETRANRNADIREKGEALDMNTGEYSVDGVSLGTEATSDPPLILKIVTFEVEPLEVRCMKGDCNGDYVPG